MEEEQGVILTKAEVARFLGKSPTRVAYGISRRWITPFRTTWGGTELFRLADVLAYAEARGVAIPEAAIAG